MPPPARFAPSKLGSGRPVWKNLSKKQKATLVSLLFAVVMLPATVLSLRYSKDYFSKAAEENLPAETETIAGDLMGFFESSSDNQQTKISYFIKTDTETLELSPPSPSLNLDKVRPGMKVQATGKRSGSKFTVSEMVPVEPAETKTGFSPKSYNGIFRLAVVPINFSNLSGNFPGESYIQTVVNGTVANFFSENSYGKLLDLVFWRIFSGGELKYLGIVFDGGRQNDGYAVAVTPTEFWTSPGGVKYAKSWKVENKSGPKISGVVRTAADNQLVETPLGNFYEGAMTFSGTINGRRVSGTGFAELTHTY